ncbi:MAG: hypothetical protein HYV03_06820 [Deltaproteobacteria bacterium]|nr:hypothetical protein [Deltaproteobacteria bacterium]
MRNVIIILISLAFLGCRGGIVWHGGVEGLLLHLPEEPSGDEPAAIVSGKAAKLSPVEEKSAEGVGAAVCGPAPMRATTICEPDVGLLCVDTPPGGVVDEVVTLTGLVDRLGAAAIGLKLVVQHEATRRFREIVPEIAADGRFTARITLPYLGAYTITVSLVRTTGQTLTETVKLSRVVAPTLTSADVTLTPDPRAGMASSDHLTVQVDLLPQCEECDLIGSQTGGTVVTIINTIGEGPASRRVVRTTDHGADGKFSLCVPIGAGSNRLEVIACNAATGFDEMKCPRVELAQFEVGGRQLAVAMQWPDGMTVPVFPAPRYPTIPLAFTVEGLAEPSATNGACTASPVQVEWNFDDVRPVCASDGVYRLSVTPIPGINLGRIQVTQGKETLTVPVTIGWGNIASPWGMAGRLSGPESGWLPGALIVGVRQAFMAETLRALTNHFARSDNLGAVLRKATELPTVAAPTPADAVRRKQFSSIRAAIPGCVGPAAGTDPLGNMRTRILQPPSIEQFEVTRVTFGPDVMKLMVEIRGLALAVQLFSDADADGAPDHKILPLKLVFRKLVLYPEIRLVRGDLPQVILTAPNDDCAFKDDTYCSHQPALVLPANFVGGATALGGFVICDGAGGSGADIVAGCGGLNTVNAQTGLLNEKVLDAINTTAYCDGSAWLTYLLREGFQNLRITVGCPSKDAGGDHAAEGIELKLFGCGSAPPLLEGRGWEFPMGLDLVHSVFTLNDQGMSARVASRGGDPALFGRVPSDVRQPSVGVINDPASVRLPKDQGLSGTHDISLGLADGLLNQLLFVGSVQGEEGAGLFDWELHEPFFQTLGFDFVKECDAATGKPPTLCELRPTVGTILGTALPTAGYFAPRQPLMVKIRGDRLMTPRVRFYRAQIPIDGEGKEPKEGPSAATREAQLIELQIPNLEAAFYALQTDLTKAADQYGNLPLAIGQDGRPLIRSMRPDDPDPSRGPIVRMKLTALLALELGPLEPDPDDPSRWMIKLRTSPNRTRLGLTVPPGGNATIVPDASLLAAVRELLLFGVALYGGEREAIRVPVPKLWPVEMLPGGGPDLMALFGLDSLRIGKEGFTLGVDPGQDYLRAAANILMIQRLPVAGQMQEWAIPE